MVADVKRRSQPVERQHVLLRNITWETFKALVVALESQPNKRLTYDDGTLEIWMPLPLHERYKKFLARLVEILTEAFDIEICSLGSTTWNREDLWKGVEADECYYIQNELAIRGRMQIDLAVDPPPDLAIEIDITSLSLPRLSIYQALDVPEVWRFDGEQLTFLKLVDGEYQEIERLLALPLAKSEDLLSLIRKAQEMGETSWAKWVRQWAKELEETV